MKKNTWLAFGLSILALMPSAIQANTFFNNRLAINTTLGYLSGKSQEFVYDSNTGKKISQLNWKLNGDAAIKGEINYKITSQLDANAQGWIIVAPGNAVMDDYDWLVPGQIHWSEWSHHDDTDLHQGNEFDFSLRAWFMDQSPYRLAALLGYQRTLFSFLAKGGCFNYDNGMDVGCFPYGEKGIGYKQTFSAPYLGIAGQYGVNKVELNGVFRFSNLVTAKDVDQHYERGLTFTEGGDYFELYHVNLNAGYYLKPQVKLFAEAMYAYFPLKKTSTTIRNNNSQTISYENQGSAGLNNKYLLLSLGIYYTGVGT